MRRRREESKASQAVLKLHLLSHHRRKPLQIAPPADVFRSHASRVVVGPLHVEELEALRPQVPHERDESDLRSVGHAVKHRFAGKEPADGDPKDAAGQNVSVPDFETVGVTKLEQAIKAGLIQTPSE